VRQCARTLLAASKSWGLQYSETPRHTYNKVAASKSWGLQYSETPRHTYNKAMHVYQAANARCTTTFEEEIRVMYYFLPPLVGREGSSGIAVVRAGLFAERAE